MERREFVRATMAVSASISLAGCDSSLQVRGGQQTATRTPKPMTPFDATEPETFTEAQRQDLERRIHDLVNAERRKNGHSPLGFNKHLAYIARTHSRDMGVKGYFAHKEPDGDRLTDRLDRYGYESEHSAENIVRPSATPDTPLSRIAELAVRGWMASPSHREQILVPSYTVEGIGAYVTSDYTVYVTEILDE